MAKKKALTATAATKKVAAYKDDPSELVVVLKEGPEVSEVRTSKGDIRNIPNSWLAALSPADQVRLFKDELPPFLRLKKGEVRETVPLPDWCKNAQGRDLTPEEQFRLRNPLTPHDEAVIRVLKATDDAKKVIEKNKKRVVFAKLDEERKEVAAVKREAKATHQSELLKRPIIFGKDIKRNETSERTIRWKAAMEWMKGKKDVTLGDLVANTPYTLNDFKVDLARGSLK